MFHVLILRKKQKDLLIKKDNFKLSSSSSSNNININNIQYKNLQLCIKYNKG